MDHLQKIGTYRRTVRASLSRVWENVFDWEHLPALHAQDFRNIDLLDRGSWGWRARVESHGLSGAQVIELKVDKPSNFYCVTTLEGPGAGNEVRTRLTPKSPSRTSIAVAFLTPHSERDRSGAAARYREIYERLWDQDEAMMMHRERILRERAKKRAERGRAMVLGRVEEIRSRLPMVVTFGGERFRILELNGALVAHSVTCRTGSVR